MAEYEVDFSLTKRGTVKIEAASQAEAEDMVNEMDESVLDLFADRVDWETYATEVA